MVKNSFESWFTRSCVCPLEEYRAGREIEEANPADAEKTTTGHEMSGPIGQSHNQDNRDQVTSSNSNENQCYEHDE